MRKKFAASLAIVVGALGAAGLARAEGADDPSYPALAPIRSVNTRAQVQATAHAADAMQSQWQASADGASYPALQDVRASQRSRAEARMQAHSAVGAADVGGSGERHGN